MQNVVIQTTCDESRVIRIKTDPIEAITYAREAAKVFVDDVYADVVNDSTPEDCPPRPKIVEHFQTPGNGRYEFTVDVPDFDWKLTVHPVG